MNEMKVESTKDDNNAYDIVRGKGKGLIVLLHGAPGVGKTSTAGTCAGYSFNLHMIEYIIDVITECVANASGKPLFPITCGK